MRSQLLHCSIFVAPSRLEVAKARLCLDSHAAPHYLRPELLHRTMAISNDRRVVMLNAVLRWIERAMAPGVQMLAQMPPSAVRQVIFFSI
jgi:hypothetical protein